MTVTTDDLFALACELPIPVPWDREVFVDSIARLRGRPIKLVPIDTSAFPEAPSGLWIARDDGDLIFHEAKTSEYHIDQIVCHEIGHMVLGHDRGLDLRTQHESDDLWRTLLPEIDLPTTRHFVARTGFLADQEREAETFAHVLMLAAAARAVAEKSAMQSVFFQ